MTLTQGTNHMKKLLTPVYSGKKQAVHNVVFTPSELVSIFAEIQELSDCDISLSENPDGSLMLTIGDSKYELRPSTIGVIPV